jgi:hypothetical protein
MSCHAADGELQEASMQGVQFAELRTSWTKPVTHNNSRHPVATIEDVAGVVEVVMVWVVLLADLREQQHSSTAQYVSALNLGSKALAMATSAHTDTNHDNL